MATNIQYMYNDGDIILPKTVATAVEMSTGGTVEAKINALQSNINFKTANVTLAATGWSGSAAPYTYTISNSNITATSIQEIIPSQTITAAELAAYQAANIVGGTQAAGSLQLRAFGVKPTIAIPVILVIRGNA